MHRFLSFLLPVFIVALLGARYLSNQKTLEIGATFLLPIRIEELHKDAFSSTAILHYENFIPIEDILSKKGQIIVKRLKTKEVRYVSLKNNQPLRSEEFYLKYIVVPNSKDREISVAFSSLSFRFKPRKSFHKIAVAYGLVHVDKQGNALLIGLTDTQGILLTKSI